MNDMVLFPLTKSKAPAVPKDTDWRQYKGDVDTAMIGVMIPQGVIVIDVDTYKGVTLQDVENVLGCQLDWSNAELQRTVRGGMHYAFAVPIGVDMINDSDVKGLVGFDTRSSFKGYIATGKGYENLTFLDSAKDALHCREMWPELPVEAVAALMVNKAKSEEDNDLLSILARQPIDITLEDAEMYLSKLDDSCADDRSTWLKVSQAIAHQFGDTETGLRLFNEFSARCPEKFDKRKNLRVWKSLFKNLPDNPVTFKTVIDLAGGKNSIITDKFDLLLEEAANVDTLEKYNAFKAKIKEIPKYEMADDMRSMLAGELYTAFGKSNNITKTDIKKALVVEKKPKQQDNEMTVPFWLDGWVYVEMTCEFFNTDLNYAIKREAFNAKYDRESECLFAEKNASTLALVDYRIPTVVDKMFWPGVGMIFEHEAKRMVNAYHLSGATPANSIDFEGEVAIAALLKHIEFTLEDKREQTILLDWLTYIIQNPGHRINWALLLQGAQGVGKSYFVTLLQHILGEHVRNLDPTAIAGRFTGWAHGALVVAVEEIRISGTNKYEVLDRMKPFITNATVQIEEKGRDHRTVPNFTSYLLLTNHKDAIPLTSGDRRYCVMFSRVQTEEQLYRELGGKDGAEKYFDNLFDLTKDNAPALARWFLSRQISADFKPKGRAPETKAREMMMAISTSPERDAVENLIDKHECEVINKDVLDVTWLNHLCKLEGDELPKTRTLSAILLEMGYEQIEGRRLKVSKTRAHHYIWVRAQSKIDCAPIVKSFYHEKQDEDVPF